ncbi:Na+/H+ antiporter subunit E [Shewanella maritima]|uniref:Na+/H+ antiporter subunit E n=1 Tax=Shewanella maritima TaxID=2520507 RepID=UPI0037358084
MMDGKKIKYIVTWSLILFVFWLCLSGFFKPLLLSFGVISVALVMVILLRMDKTDNENQKLALNLHFFRYVFWLLGQIILSSVEVTKLVWGKHTKLSPAIGKLPVNNVPEKSRVLYANSITLTPGTLAIDIDKEHVTVHALDKESLESLSHGDMAQKVNESARGDD